MIEDAVRESYRDSERETKKITHCIRAHLPKKNNITSGFSSSRAIAITGKMLVITAWYPAAPPAEQQN